MYGYILCIHWYRLLILCYNSFFHALPSVGVIVGGWVGGWVDVSRQFACFYESDVSKYTLPNFNCM